MAGYFPDGPRTHPFALNFQAAHRDSFTAGENAVILLSKLVGDQFV